MEDTLVPIALFAIIPAIVWAVSAYRFKAHKASMGLLEVMAGKGEPVTPELVRTLGVRRRPKHADLRTGLVLIAIALATLVMGGAIPEPEAQAAFAGIAAFPGFIGLVFIGLWIAVSRKDAD